MEDQFEKMDEFFNKRANAYEDHMIADLGLTEFYNEIQECLPGGEGKLAFIDLGCGTGLEIEKIFNCNPNAEITGIDLSSEMLEVLKAKFNDKSNQLNVVCGSYFDFEFDIVKYDCAISTYSLHHFTVDEKLMLYKRIYNSLKENGIFINGDYVVGSIEEESFYISENERIRKENGITTGFYHYDTPLCITTEEELLLKAGFKNVVKVKQWESTIIFKCYK